MADSGWKDGSEARVETKALVSDFYLQFKNKEMSALFFTMVVIVMA